MISCPAAFHTDTDSTTRGDRGERGGEDKVLYALLPKRVLGSGTAREAPEVVEEIVDERFDLGVALDFDFREKRRRALGLGLDFGWDEGEGEVGDGAMTSSWMGTMVLLDRILGLSALRWNFASIAAAVGWVVIFSFCCIFWSGTFSVGVRWRLCFLLFFDVPILSGLSI